MSTAVVIRTAAFAASVAAHGIALAGAFAHAPGDDAATIVNVQNTPIEVPAPELLPIEEPDTRARAEARTAAQPAHHHSHKHDYPVPEGHDDTPHDPSIVHAPLPSLVVHAPHVPDEAPAEPATPPHFELTPPLATAPAPDAHDGAGEGAAAPHGHDHEHSAESVQNAPIAESAVDAPARCLSKPTLRYPASAEHAGIEAEVPLEIVVDASGHVTAARALGHAGFGLDAAAEEGVRGYTFDPARKHGRAVSVRMRYVVTFELR